MQFALLTKTIINNLKKETRYEKVVLSNLVTMPLRM